MRKPRVLRPFAAVLVGVWSIAASAMSPELKAFQDAFIALGEQVRPCVVNIDVDTQVESRIPPEMKERYEDLFRFFGIPREDAEDHMTPRIIPAQGSGFIFDKQGHIITNNHVVQDATSITVRLWDGDEYKAKVVGSDSQTDLAVIKIETTRDLPAADLGDSDTVKVGQFAIALGSPQGLEGSFSFGHVTALGRSNLRLPGLRFQNFIQTDAAINLGNSGGPLVDIDGKVIGINTAIVFGAESLGFASGINQAKKIVPVLIAEGKIKRGYLGVKIQDAELVASAEGLPDKNGAFVDNVQPGAPAEKAGVQNYDVIRKLNGEVIKSAADLQNRISDLPPSSTVDLDVWRDGKEIKLSVALDEFPESIASPKKEKSVLGLNVQSLTPELQRRLGLEPDTAGVVVENVEPGSVAFDAGIHMGDVITEVAKEPVTSVEDFKRLMTEHATPGASVLIRVLRGNEQASVLVLKVPTDKA